MRVQLFAIPIIVLLCLDGLAVADYKDDIGFTRLMSEQGANTPDGSGVPVTQAEASTAGTGNPAVFLPDDSVAEFAGKVITDQSGDTSGSFSGHATSVGRSFYGSTTSVATGISTINAYLADGWLGSDYLYTGVGSFKPDQVPDRIANHSWIANATDDAVDLEIVKRVDWVIENDEFIQAVGLRNSTSTNSPLLSAAFNVIAVGVTDGVHGRGSVLLDAPYFSGRVRPELVAPFTNTSSSTPVIAAAAALLVDAGHATPSLSTDPAEVSTSSRAGITIYNAERSEVVKAVLMAGADRVTNNSTNPDLNTPKDITNYRLDPVNQSANGLDVRFGAGQLNIYNSFHILTGGEQNSIEDVNTGGGSIGTYGFDYDPSFGGAGTGGGGNVTGSYTFSTTSGQTVLTAALVWNVDVADGRGNSFPGDATLYDLDLRLYDETGGAHVLEVASDSSIENTENIRIFLDAGKDYLLEVTPKAGQGSFEWDYALAWQMTDPVDTDSDGAPDIIDTDDDNDGLLDADEATVGTNPLLADTDGDGFDDGMEVAYGSDPLLASDTPAGNVINNGDINNDGKVDVADVLLATRMVLGQLTPTGEQLIRADMVPDGQINAGDLVRIQQLALAL